LPWIWQAARLINQRDRKFALSEIAIAIFFVQKPKAMTQQEFNELVREMRFNQKQFFKTRSQTYLRKSQELERQVDSYLKNNTGITQGDLFNV
jgi:hypothetical protein